MSKTRAGNGQISPILNFQGTQGIVLPVGTTLNRNATPNAGEIRYNSTLGLFEGYTGSVWGAMGPYPFQTIDYFTGDGVTQDFICDFGITTSTAVIVTLNGVQLRPSVDYQITGTNTLRFVDSTGQSVPPGNNSDIIVRGFGPLTSSGVTASSIGRSQLATINTGTGGQVLAIDTSTGNLKYISLPVQDPVLGGALSGTVSSATIVANAVGINELRVSDGVYGQVLATDGSGNLSFISIKTLATISSTAPLNPVIGSLWLDETDANFSIYVGNGTWIGTSPPELPGQTGNSGKFLTTDGSTVSWTTVNALPSQTGNSGKYLLTNGTTATWAIVNPSIIVSDSEPLSPSNGNIWFNSSDLNTYVYYNDGNSTQWVSIGLTNSANILPSQTGNSGKYLTTDGNTVSWASAGAGLITIRDTAPTNPSIGDIWFDSTKLNSYIYYNDGDSNQWVSINSARGVTGATGAQGVQGISGGQGLSGTAVAQGATGAQGTFGIQGTTGAGTQGTRGIQGIVGPVGFTGTKGAQGTQGIIGVQGLSGTAVAQGAIGSQGITGTGVQGAKGTQGALGPQGAFGPQGVTGSQGITGTQGIQGVGNVGTQGTTGTQGIQGVGNVGTQGTTGTQGIQGVGNVGTQGTTGTQGIQGVGNVGTQGTTGSQGIRGDTGLAFTIAKTYSSVAALTADTSPTSIISGQFAIIETGNPDNAENSKLYLWNGSTWIYINDLSGSAGIQGVQGTQGTGTQGASGIQGPTGVQGTSGVAASTPAAVSGQANTSTGYFALPSGTTAQRPASPVVGMLRYNTTLGSLEQYNITGWETIGGNQPVIAGITAQIYNAFAGSITIAGNYFGLNAVTVRFSFGATISDVSITPSSTTSITVSVPSAIYSLTAGTSGNVSVIDSTGRQSNGFGKTVIGLPGSSSSYPAASPYAIRAARGSTPTAGVYWFSNAGFNAGGAFQAYADWSTDSTYGMLVLCGLLMTDNARTSYTQFGTAATSTAGTPGFRSTHNLASNTILSGWTGDTRNRCYLGMTSQSGGSDIGSSTNQWLLMNTSLTVFKNMFNDAPGNGEFDFATGIVNTSTGASGRLYYSTSHGSNLYQMTNAGNTVNANLWFEVADPSSTDMNHSAMVWASGTGAYYANNPPFTSRWMFMAMSPDNT